MEHYLDNASTTRTCEEAASAALELMTSAYGNPSSTHTKGREAKKILEMCRKTVADALYAKPEEIVFTSCGSESDNWAITAGAEAMKRRGRHIISSMAEHDAVRASLDLLEKNGYEITRLRPDSTGRINVSQVADAVRKDTVLVSLMMVNNETGAVTDIKEIAGAVKDIKKDVLIHTDAVQAFKKIPFKAKTLGADLISISGHKIHAVKGIGALYIKDGVRLKPFLTGGHQENGRRAGTEAMPQIAAFAAACGMDPQTEMILSLKNELIKRIEEELPEVTYIRTAAPHIISLSMPGWKSEVIMNFLEGMEVYVSKSSACRQGRRSHVLEAIGMRSDIIDGSLRVGLSRYNTLDDIDALIEGLKAARKLAHNRRLR